MVLGRDQAELCHPGTRFRRPSEAAGCVDEPRLYDGPRPPLSPLPNSANIKTSLSAGPPRWKITSSQQRDRKNFIKLKNYSKEHFSLAEKKAGRVPTCFLKDVLQNLCRAVRTPQTVVLPNSAAAGNERPGRSGQSGGRGPRPTGTTPPSPSVCRDGGSQKCHLASVPSEMPCLVGGVGVPAPWATLGSPAV